MLRQSERQMKVSRDSMSQQMILLRVEDGTREGWQCMALQEFLEKISLDAWKVEQVLVGMGLPSDRHRIN